MGEDVHSSVSQRTVAGEEEQDPWPRKGLCKELLRRMGPIRLGRARVLSNELCHPSLVPPRVDSCPCVFVVLPRSFPAPHPTCSLHSSPSARPFPAHLSCFHGHRFILHSSSHPRYRKLLFSLFTDPLLASSAGEAPQEDGGPALDQGHPCHVPGTQPGVQSLCSCLLACVDSAATISAL